MTPQQANELLPCLHCNAQKLQEGSFGDHYKFIECLNCGATGPTGESLAEIIAAWNRRAPAPTSEPPIGTPEGMRIYAKGYATGRKKALAGVAPTSEQDAAELAEWRRLKDPAVLHASLLRGQPARLPDYVFQHIAGVAPTSEPGARDAQIVTAGRELLAYLDEHDWGGMVEGQTANRFRAALATPSSPTTVCAPNCFYGDCPPCVDAGIAPASPAEHVAEVGSTYQLVWAGSGPIAPIVEKHGLKVGSKLYAHPAADPAPLVAQTSPNSYSYRKRPVVIEAFQFQRRNNGVIPYPDWYDDAVTRNDIITQNTGKWHDPTTPAYCEIKTLEGVMRGDEGDWIIRGVKGEMYPCKPDIFALSYEPAAPEASPLVEDAQRIVAGKVEGCGCRKCNPEMVGQWFFLCSICGNKRCPHANDHRNECTDSNEPGQKGSAYESQGRATTGNATADDGKDK